MPRRKFPDLSWRACRVTSALALAALITVSLAVNADAEHNNSTASARPAPAPSMLLVDADLKNLDGQIGRQATAQAEAVEAAAKARAEAAAKAAAEAREKARAEAAAKAAAEAREKARAEAAAKAREQARTRPVQRTSRSSVSTRSSLTGTVSSAKNLARARMSSTQYNCLDNLVRRESGWNHRAQNPSSGAYGLFQALPASKMSSAGSDWRTNPLTQMRWGLSYIENRYGSPCGAWNFWQQNHWY